MYKAIFRFFLNKRKTVNFFVFLESLAVRFAVKRFVLICTLRIKAGKGMVIGTELPFFKRKIADKDPKKNALVRYDTTTELNSHYILYLIFFF